MIYEHTYKYALCLTFIDLKFPMYISFMCLFVHLLNIGLTILCDRYSVSADGGVVVSLCDEGFVADVSSRSLGEAVLSFPWGGS